MLVILTLGVVASCSPYASVDIGVPFNIASYSLLTLMVAQVTNLQPGEFVHTLGDVHLYQNHIEQAQVQLGRQPQKLPQMKLNSNIGSLFDFRFEDFHLQHYAPHPHIPAPVAV